MVYAGRRKPVEAVSFDFLPCGIPPPTIAPLIPGIGPGCRGNILHVIIPLLLNIAYPSFDMVSIRISRALFNNRIRFCSWNRSSTLLHCRMNGAHIPEMRWSLLTVN